MQIQKVIQTETFEEVLSRRIFLQGAAAALPALVVSGTLLQSTDSVLAQTLKDVLESNDNVPSSLTFDRIALDQSDAIKVPTGYRSQVVIRWGDPLFASAPAFDINNQNRATQEQQFGFNCDFVYYAPLEATFPLDGEKGGEVQNDASNRGILCVNHEYTDPNLMFPGYSATAPTAAQVDADIAAHGMSFVEVRKDSATGNWIYVQNSPFNRRVTGFTPAILTGPAAGDDMLKTSADPTGRNTLGIFNNCGGGWTPWGTILTAEENFNQYFGNLNGLPTTDPRRAIHAAYGTATGATGRRWENFYSRFNIATEPNEAFRTGYIVEIDPYNPNFVPRKHTALGRTKHEAATCYRTLDNRAVAYMGDDQTFQYVYKFVSAKTISSNRTENFDVLETGTLYVAKYNADGTGVWLPLVAGQGALANWTQAQICYNTRGAATLAGATPMDRPEDVERNPVNGKIYAAFTNNSARGTGTNPTVDAANPRSANRAGHIIEMTEANNDGAATTFTWEIFMLCGNPRRTADRTFFAGLTNQQARFLCSPLACPDNISFDARGNLWIATDGMDNVLPGNDAIYAVAVTGTEKGMVKQFLSSVPGAEVAGIFISQDDENLWATIQHPGEGSTLANPSSRFPDYNPAIPPRPSVVVVTKTIIPKFIGS